MDDEGKNMIEKANDAKEKAFQKGRNLLENEKVKRVSGNPIIKLLFPLPKKYMALIDSGNLFKQPFKILYGLFAIINIIVPIYIMYKAIELGLFSATFKFVIVFLMLWVLITIASFFGFSIWWDRKNKITSSTNENDSFVATPVFSHFIQTFGEFVGSYIAIVGSLGSLIISVMLGSDDQNMRQLIFVDLTSYGWLSFIVMLLVGFGVVIISRFVAEQFRALSAIANNTKK